MMVDFWAPPWHGSCSGPQPFLHSPKGWAGLLPAHPGPFPHILRVGPAALPPKANCRGTRTKPSSSKTKVAVGLLMAATSSGSKSGLCAHRTAEENSATSDTTWRLPPNTVYVGRDTKWGPRLMLAHFWWATDPYAGIY